MWRPISREALLEQMHEALERADDPVRAAWDRIRVEPQKWQCSPWGDAGGGFWVVARRGGEVVWYNDIEEGFNSSPFTNLGIIDEYRSDQTGLGALLAALPEAVAAEGYASEQAASEVPPELAGAGRVTRRQTTFWDLQTQSAGLVRVHFSHKEEMAFASAEYDRLELADEHPLLAAYRQPWASVFVTEAKRCGAGLLPELAARIRLASGGWRTAEEYLKLGGRGVLHEGHGLLLRAPEPIAAMVAAALQSAGAVPSVVLDPAGRLRRPVRALVLGKSFVIAEAFRFAPAGAEPSHP